MFFLPFFPDDKRRRRTFVFFIRMHAKAIGKAPFAHFEYARFTAYDDALFAFFRKDYEMFRTRMFKDYFLLIQGRVQPRQWGKEGELELKVTSITQLSDVRDAVREIKFYLPTHRISRAFIDEMIEVAKVSKGKAQLKFSLQDVEEEVLVSAYSRRYKVALTKEIADFIEKYDLTYTMTVNQ